MFDTRKVLILTEHSFSGVPTCIPTLSSTSQSCLKIDVTSTSSQPSLKLIDPSLSAIQRIPSNLTLLMTGSIPFGLAWTYNQSEEQKRSLHRFLTVKMIKLIR